MSVYAQNQQLERQVAATLASGIMASGIVLKEGSSVEGAAEQGVAVLNAVIAALYKSSKEKVVHG